SSTPPAAARNSPRRNSPRSRSSSITCRNSSATRRSTPSSRKPSPPPAPRASRTWARSWASSSLGSRAAPTWARFRRKSRRAWEAEGEGRREKEEESACRCHTSSTFSLLTSSRNAMARIPESFINDLINRLDIVEVIDARVPLKKVGREYHACCPFHNEKTPSFTVSPQKQFYHCFGCGAHGTAIGFVMAYDRLEFPDAVRSLAESLGLEGPVEGGGEEKRDTGLYDVMEAAAGHFRQQLKGNERAIAYLRNRGLTGEIAAEFGLGYAPDSWDGLTKSLRSRGFRKEQLIATGMAIPGQRGEPYDRFRDRTMLPIPHRRGRVIPFGGPPLRHGTPQY